MRLKFKNFTVAFGCKKLNSCSCHRSMNYGVKWKQADQEFSNCRSVVCDWIPRARVLRLEASFAGSFVVKIKNGGHFSIIESWSRKALYFSPPLKGAGWVDAVGIYETFDKRLSEDIFYSIRNSSQVSSSVSLQVRAKSACCAWGSRKTNTPSANTIPSSETTLTCDLNFLNYVQAHL